MAGGWVLADPHATLVQVRECRPHFCWMLSCQDLFISDRQWKFPLGHRDHVIALIDNELRNRGIEN